MNDDTQQIPIRKVDGVQPRQAQAPQAPEPVVTTPQVKEVPVVAEPVKIEKTSSKTNGDKKMKRIVGVLILLVLVLGAGAVYFYQQSKVDSGEKTSAQNKKELADTIVAVGKLIVLPTDEEPTMATVTDPEKLRDQAFFKNAEKGDRVLIYTKAQKAILYSPTKHKIIDVSPVNLNSAPQVQGAGTEPTSGVSTQTQ